MLPCPLVLPRSSLAMSLPEVPRIEALQGVEAFHDRGGLLQRHLLLIEFLLLLAKLGQRKPSPLCLLIDPRHQAAAVQDPGQVQLLVLDQGHGNGRIRLLTTAGSPPLCVRGSVHGDKQPVVPDAAKLVGHRLQDVQLY